MPEMTSLESFELEDLLDELRKRSDKKSGRAGAGPPATALAGFTAQNIADAVKSRQKVIYGTDDREDLFEVANPALRDDADSVVSLWSSNSVAANGDGTSTLSTVTFANGNNLCSSERFREQPTGAFCSGFLVAPDVVATAGHCVDAGDVTSTRFVFGFQMTDAATARTVISNDEIYRGLAVISRRLASDGSDWALVLLDRPVTNHRIASLRRIGRIPNGQAVHVIGHPSGLPLKVAGGANVRDNGADAFFVANLDTYGGNSGSPVYNSDTHQVEGILVRGEADFVATDAGCQISLVCPSTGCRGEDCTRGTELDAPVLVATGRLTLLRVHDVGTMFGPPTDQIDADVVAEVDAQPGRFFGFQLRDDGQANAHRRMLDILRDAFNHGRPVRIEYTWDGSGTRNGRVLRVSTT